MEFKLLLTTFGLVFLAELGDKTQLATLVLSSNNASKLAVFIGSAGALVLCSLIAVLAGTAVGRWIPDHYIKMGAGIAFIAVGVWTLISAVWGGEGMTLRRRRCHFPKSVRTWRVMSVLPFFSIH